MDNDERYIPIEQSIIDSFNEIRDMDRGRLPKRTWDELKAELEEEERQERCGL